MKTLALIVLSGLAATAANAQLSIVNNRAGSFIDLSTDPLATRIASGDDSNHTIVTTVGNSIFAAGNVRINNNGHISAFGSLPPTTGPLFSNATIPPTGNPTAFGNLPASPQSVLMAFWDDIIPVSGSATSGIYWREIGNTLIVQWNNQDSFGASGAGTVTFQLQLFANASRGDVLAQFIYADSRFSTPPATSTADFGGRATIGFSTQIVAPGINNVLHSFDTANAVSDGLVLSIVPTPNAAALLGLGGLAAFRRRRA